jgi:hypothetical protein
VRKEAPSRDRFRAAACVGAVLVTLVALVTTLAAAIVDNRAMRLPNIAITVIAALGWLASGVQGIVDWRALTAGTRAKQLGTWYAGVNLAAFVFTGAAAADLALTFTQVALLPLAGLTVAEVCAAIALALCAVLRNDLAAAARLRRLAGATSTGQFRARRPD